VIGTHPLHRVEGGLDPLGCVDAIGLPDVLVTRDLVVPVQDSHRNDVGGGSQIPGHAEVGGIVFELVLVDVRETRVELKPVLVRQDLGLLGVFQPGIEERREIVRASLQDGDEGETLVMEGLGNDVVEEIRDPIHRLGDEGHVRDPQGGAQRIHGVEVGAPWAGVALLTLWSGCLEWWEKPASWSGHRCGCRAS
jgi:hypothetical protein